MDTPQATFRFYGPLNDHLPAWRRQRPILRRLKDRGSVKDAIEALGVPHPEVELILVNGLSVDFSHPLEPGDRISVFPRFRQLPLEGLSQVRPPPLTHWRFVLDVHLGKLASHLRLLGFDAVYRNDASDAELADISCREHRLLLTQDRGLLKRRIVTYGYLVRSRDPERQVVEVIDQFSLRPSIQPYRRCLRCNGALRPVAKPAIEDQLPRYTRQCYDSFTRCGDCGRIYWQGAHHRRLQALIKRFAGAEG